MPRAGWLAVGAVVGALVAGGGFPVVTLALVGMAASGTGWRLARRQRWPTGLLALGIGAVLLRAALSLLLAGGASAGGGDAAIPGGAWDHEAAVVSVNAPQGGSQRAIVELRAPDPPDRVWATLPRYPPIAPTDVIRFGGALEPAPIDDEFGAFLARSGIAYTVRARSMERVGSDGSPLAALEGLRRGAALMITTALPEPQGGLAAAMSIGLRDLVSRDVSDDFRAAGLSHVVAISGWHIAMLAAIIAGALGRLSRRKRTIVVIAVVSAYALFAGASPGILRAAVMAGVVLVARESGRTGSASAALGLTVAGMLVIDPNTISDLGFQLSAAATAGLLTWGSRASEWFGKRLPKRTPTWLLESLGVSTAAQAATLPLVLFHFGTLSIVAPLANLLMAPIVAPGMLVTAIAFVCGLAVTLGVPAIVTAPFVLTGSLLIGLMIEIARFCGRLPFANVVIEEPLNLVAAATVAVVIGMIVRRRRAPAATGPETFRAEESPRSGRRLAFAGAGAAVCILVASVNAAQPDGRLHITVLDVGQGDAIFLRGPDGGRALIDTGPDPDRLTALLDERIPAWDRRLDLVVITHPHEDHIAGVAALLDRYRIGEVAEPGMIGPGPGDAAFRRRMAELGRDSRTLAAGDSVRFDGITLHVRWPLPGTVPLRPPDGGTGINNVSIVLDASYGARRIVLAGDVEEDVDRHLLEAGLAADERRVDVLKVAHHGSGTATTDGFLEHTAPSVAVISAGWRNPYGHPSPSTVARLEDAGAKVFRTDLDGTVDISTNGTDLVANAGGGRPRPATPPPPTQPVGVGFCPIGPAVSGRRRRTYNRRNVHPITRGGGATPARPPAAGLAAWPLHGGG
ncbi:MAG TPA: DNA internalization-related competence protein ComEC/Rec2 [Candidatus Limnocylindrales bacterium]|nr:DNA internalization-related competence protein ComEC/Rec2 [Candidatus Limnocylindrales bacterium]